MTGRAAKSLAWIQGLYFLATGLWPLFDIDSFQAVTGPKTDLWLVRTVGLLVTAIGGTLLVAAWRRHITSELVLLAVSSAVALAAIDLIYALAGVIRKIYLADAALESLLVAGWVCAWFMQKRTPAHP